MKKIFILLDVKPLILIVMKKFTFALLVVLSFNFVSSDLYAQKFNGYKYIMIEDLIYDSGSRDKYGLNEEVIKFFKKKKFKIIRVDEDGDIYQGRPKGGLENVCEALWVDVSHEAPESNSGGWWYCTVSIDFYDCNDDEFVKFTGRNKAGFTAKASVKGAAKTIFEAIESRMGKYKFNPSKTPTEN